MRFLVVFVPDSTTFETHPTVIESVSRSVPVEQSHSEGEFFYHLLYIYGQNKCVYAYLHDSIQNTSLIGLLYLNLQLILCHFLSQVIKC